MSGGYDTLNRLTSANATLNFVFTDMVGTRRVMTDYAGNVMEACHSLPYGNGASGSRIDIRRSRRLPVAFSSRKCHIARTSKCKVNSGPAQDCAASPTEHLFTNKERDAETGNDYFGARYYASSMGRFLTPDWSAKVEPVPYSKLDDPQTLNLYAYVGDNPFVREDADGHDGSMGSGGSTFAENTEAEAGAAKKNNTDQQQNPTPQVKSPKALNQKLIEDANGKYNECVKDGYDSAVIHAAADVAIDNVHEATEAAKESAIDPTAGPPRPKQNPAAQMSMEEIAEVSKLHEECLSKNPLAALSKNFDNWVKAGDVGKVPDWLDKLSDVIK